MKHLLTLSFLIVFTKSFGQISPPTKVAPAVTVGKIAPLGGFVADLTYQINDGDTTYTLRFNDAQYKQINSIESVRFSADGGTVDELYNLFKSVFLDENKKNKDYIVQFTLGRESVTISNTKSLGVTSAMFTRKSSFFTLTEKQVDKLFGKN